VCSRKRSRDYEEEQPILRESLLESVELPNVTLAKENVTSRWTTARVRAQADDTLKIATPSNDAIGSVTARLATGMSVKSMVPVMFSDDHVGELRPTDWDRRPENRLGKGSYGMVHRAEWRGLKVAIKALELPREPRNERETAVEGHKKKLKRITKDYVKEVEVGCDVRDASSIHARASAVSLTHSPARSDAAPKPRANARLRDEAHAVHRPGAA
jgi:hypothetical protein